MNADYKSKTTLTGKRGRESYSCDPSHHPSTTPKITGKAQTILAKRKLLKKQPSMSPWMTQLGPQKTYDMTSPNVMLRHFTPVPSEEIRPLFEYYFKPQDYIINTQKYLDCNAENRERLAEHAGFPEPIAFGWDEKSVHEEDEGQAREEKPALTDKQIIRRRIDHDKKDLAQGWKSIYDFIYENDKKSYNYVVQLFKKMRESKSADKDKRKKSKTKKEKHQSKSHHCENSDLTADDKEKDA